MYLTGWLSVGILLGWILSTALEQSRHLYTPGSRSRRRAARTAAVRLLERTARARSWPQITKWMLGLPPAWRTRETMLALVLLFAVGILATATDHASLSNLILEIKS